MNYPRKATEEELKQLTSYIMSTTSESEEEAKEMVENGMYVAVFDHYVDRGYVGQMMVVVGDDGLSEVLIWDSNRHIRSTLKPE